MIIVWDNATSSLAPSGNMFEWEGDGDVVEPSYSEEMVHASLMNHFVTNFSETASLSLDEQQFNYDAATESVEFNAIILDDFQLRQTSKKFNRLEVHAHCWAKPGSNAYRAYELADAIISLYSQKDIPVYDYDYVGSREVGWVRLKEARVIDRTQEMSRLHKIPGKHITVIIPGYAQETI